MKATSFLVGVTFVQRSGESELSPLAIQRMVVESLNALSNRGQMLEAIVASPAEEVALDLESTDIEITLDEEPAPSCSERASQMGRVLDFPGY